MIKKLFNQLFKNNQRNILSNDESQIKEVENTYSITVDLECCDEIKDVIASKALDFINNTPDWSIFTLDMFLRDILKEYNLPIPKLCQKANNITIKPLL